MEKRSPIASALGAAMVLGLLAGAPAASADPKQNPARRAYAGVMKDLLKAQRNPRARVRPGEYREPPKPNLKRIGRKILESYYRRWSGGEEMSSRTYRHAWKHIRRGWIENRLIGTTAASFALWFREQGLGLSA